MVAYSEGLILAALDEIAAVYREAGREPDLYAMVWAVRMQYDADVGMMWLAAKAKHLAELRKELGLPPLSFPATDTWPRLGLSYYTSLSDPRVDLAAFAGRLADAGADYTRVWLIDAWAVGANAGTGCYDGFLPWLRSSDGRFDLWTLNQAYLQRLRMYVEHMNDHGILPQLSGWELYAWSSRKQGMLWVPDATHGPFRNNRQGVFYADDGAFDRIGLPTGEDAFLAKFYEAVVQTLQGLSFTVELGNEMPEKPLHERLKARWRQAGYAGSISVNRNEDTPGQFANMKIGIAYDRIAFHGKRDLGYLDEVYADEPTYRTFRQFYASDPDQSRIILSSDGCRKSTNPDDAYDYNALRAVARDTLDMGSSYEHQSCMKLRGFTENRIDLDDLEVDWLRTLKE
jgi:hypothetical protein